MGRGKGVVLVDCMGCGVFINTPLAYRGFPAADRRRTLFIGFCLASGVIVLLAGEVQSTTVVTKKQII